MIRETPGHRVAFRSSFAGRSSGSTKDGMRVQSTDRPAGSASWEARSASGSDTLPPHWHRTATHYERLPWQPRVMVLYSLTTLGPARFAWRYERTTSLWIYASVLEAITAVEAVLTLQMRRAHRRPTAPISGKRHRSRPPDPRQPDLFGEPAVMPCR